MYSLPSTAKQKPNLRLLSSFSAVVQGFCFYAFLAMTADKFLIMTKSELFADVPALTACAEIVAGSFAFIFIESILRKVHCYLLFMFICQVRNLIKQAVRIFNHTDTYQSIRLPRSRVTGSVFCSATLGSSSSYSDICICIVKVTFAPGKSYRQSADTHQGRKLQREVSFPLRQSGFQGFLQP